MTTAFLHVGLHKTGSTSIQKYFYEHDVIDFNPERIFKWKEKEVVVNDLKNEYDKDVLFSYEQLSWMNKDESVKLIKMLKKSFTNVVVIIFFRDKTKLAISHKNQSVKSMAIGATKEREIYGLSYNTHDFGNPQYLDYNSHLEKWESSNKIHHLDFDTLIKEGKVLDTFFEILGLNEEPGDLPRTNSSLCYSKFIIHTHIFKKCTDKHTIESLFKILNKVQNQNNKISKDEELVINEGSLAILDLFYETLNHVSNNSSLSSDEINIIRDTAVLLENEDLNLSHKLMTIAKKHRPNGQYITNKITEYKKTLNIN